MNSTIPPANTTSGITSTATSMNNNNTYSDSRTHGQVSFIKPVLLNHTQTNQSNHNLQLHPNSYTTHPNLSLTAISLGSLTGKSTGQGIYHLSVSMPNVAQAVSMTTTTTTTTNGSTLVPPTSTVTTSTTTTNATDLPNENYYKSLLNLSSYSPLHIPARFTRQNTDEHSFKQQYSQLNQKSKTTIHLPNI
ncbi:unnamed protein product [Trichobilharzia regenti]|nr:unnamed protein product [Trichobilharzia regenti]